MRYLWILEQGVAAEVNRAKQLKMTLDSNPGVIADGRRPPLPSSQLLIKEFVVARPGMT